MPGTDKERLAAERVQALLSGPRRVVASFNDDNYARARQRLEAPARTDREKRIEALKVAFARHNAHAAEISDRSPLPTEVRQQFVSRLGARMEADLWGMRVADVNPTQWGSILSYRVTQMKLPKVYKIGAPGGNFQEIHANRDSVFSLGDPVIYTTPEILVPRFDPRFLDRYIQDLQVLADEAAIAINEQVDSDLLTAKDNQLVTPAQGTLVTNGFDWVSSKVRGLPTYNDVDYSAASGGYVTKDIYMDLAHRSMLLKRRLEWIGMHPDTIMTLWQQTDAGAGATDYFPELPDVLRARIFEEGERVFTYMWNTRFPLPDPTNSIDCTGDDRYFWVLMSPLDDRAPRGLVWLFTYPEPINFGPNGAAYFVDQMQYLRTEVRNGQIYEVFVVQKAIQIAYTDYQKPNVIRAQYAT